jgi:protein-disulfide isomerase
MEKTPLRFGRRPGWLDRFVPVLAFVCSCCLGCWVGRAADSAESAAAPTEVTVVIFSDFFSPACAEVNGLLDELAQSRHVTLQRLFKHAPSDTAALPAHEAALAAGAQGKFQEMHDLLFKESRPTGSVLLRLAKSLDLDLKQFENALDEREFRNRVIRDIAEARGLGVHTTPTLFLNGTKVQGLDELKSLVRAPAPPAAPSWETTPVEPLALNFEGSPTSGPSNAPVTVIEFTDFRCGFCRINSRVITDLVAAYPGKIRRVFKNYPIEPEGAGMRSHVAALGALDQGKFWEMHQSIMARPLEPGDDLFDRAKSMGIDLTLFQKSLNDPAKRSLLRRDVAEGEQLGIRATPTTFLNGKRLVGRQSLEVLKKHVEVLLGSPGAVTGQGGESLTSLGDPQALEHIEAFMDLGHPDSAAWVALIKEIVRERPGVQVQFRHFPKAGDPRRFQFHEAAMAAAEQHQFWEMCDQILARTGSVEPEATKGMAGTLGLDPGRFASAISEHRYKGRIEADMAEGRQRGLQGPSLFLNGEQFKEVPTVSSLAYRLDQRACCGRATTSDTAPPGVKASPLK